MLGQIRTWAFDIVNSDGAITEGRAAIVYATSNDDTRAGMKGRLHITDDPSYTIIDYSLTDSLALEEDTIQRFMVVEGIDGFFLSATPSLQERTMYNSLTQQQPPHELLPAPSTEDEYLNSYLLEATHAQLEELLELMECGRFGDDHLSSEEIDGLLPGETA